MQLVFSIFTILLLYLITLRFQFTFKFKFPLQFHKFTKVTLRQNRHSK